MHQSLSNDIATLLGTVTQHILHQKEYVNDIRQQLQEANQRALEASEHAASTLESVLDEEKQNSERERQELMLQIQSLLSSSAEKQACRLRKNVNGVRTGMKNSRTALQQADVSYSREMDNWLQKENSLLEKVLTSEKELKSKMAENLDVRGVKIVAIMTAANPGHRCFRQRMLPSSTAPVLCMRRRFASSMNRKRICESRCRHSMDL